MADGEVAYTIGIMSEQSSLDHVRRNVKTLNDSRIRCIDCKAHSLNLVDKNLLKM